jgi:hypothetical protein
VSTLVLSQTILQESAFTQQVVSGAATGVSSTAGAEQEANARTNADNKIIFFILILISYSYIARKFLKSEFIF